MERVLLVGCDPETVEFCNPALTTCRGSARLHMHLTKDLRLYFA